nr:immunoglobulin heavy chain junction region [Mus musculus]
CARTYYGNYVHAYW